MMRCRNKGVASREGVEDVNNGKLSFKTLKAETTPSDLCMSRVGSTLQHESARQLWSKERLDSRGVGISTWKVTPSSIGSSSLSRMVRVGFLGFENESRKCTMVKKEWQVDSN